MDGEKVVRAYRYLEISAFSLEDVIFLEKEDSGLYIYWRHGISKNVNFNLADVKTFRRRFDSELAETFLSRLKQLSFEQREQAETDAFDDGVLIIVAKWEKGDVIFISEQALGRSNISDTRLRGFLESPQGFGILSGKALIDEWD